MKYAIWKKRTMKFQLFYLKKNFYKNYVYEKINKK